MEKSSGRGGISFAWLLTIVFIILKLVGVISWSWVWVFAPIWIPIAYWVVLLLIVTIIANIVNR